jgi:FdhD protein
MRRNIITVPIRKVERGGTIAVQDLLAVEEPLEIRVHDGNAERNVAITMRTPGNDEELAAGFLFTEGILQSASCISAITIPARNVVTVSLVNASGVDLERLDRHFYMSSSCGVCGKASIQSLEASGCTSPPRDGPRINREIIHRLPEVLRSRQMTFERTGGLHAAALFDASGELVDARQGVREDVGRHNAVDKLIGAALLRGDIPLHDRILMVSGRASFELVQKALMAGIAVMAAVGAPSSLAVETALRFGMTLAGFVRDERYNVYSGEWRLLEGVSHE